MPPKSNTKKTASDSDAKRTRTNWSQIYTHEGYAEYISSKLAELQELILAGEAGWRKEQVAKFRADTRAEERRKQQEKRKLQKLDAKATSLAYLKRLKEEFPEKEHYECFDGKWISTFSVKDQYSADQLDVDDLPEDVQYSAAVTLFDEATEHGFAPLGVIPHGATRQGSKESATYTYKFPLDDESLRVYAGPVMGMRKIKDGHPLALISQRDNQYVLPEGVEDPTTAVPTEVEAEDEHAEDDVDGAEEEDEDEATGDVEEGEVQDADTEQGDATPEPVSKPPPSKSRSTKAAGSKRAPRASSSRRKATTA